MKIKDYIPGFYIQRFEKSYSISRPEQWVYSFEEMFCYIDKLYKCVYVINYHNPAKDIRRQYALVDYSPSNDQFILKVISWNGPHPEENFIEFDKDSFKAKLKIDFCDKFGF